MRTSLTPAQLSMAAGDGLGLLINISSHPAVTWRTLLLRIALILTAGRSRIRSVWFGSSWRFSRGIIVIPRRWVLLVPMRLLSLLAKQQVLQPPQADAHLLGRLQNPKQEDQEPVQQVPVTVEGMALLEPLAEILHLLGTDGEDLLFLHADLSLFRIWRNRLSRG